MVKLDEKSKDDFRAFVREHLRSRGIDPDTVDIEPLVKNPEEPITLPNGDQLSFVEVAHPNHWGPYLRAMNFFGTGLSKIMEDLNNDFAMVQKKLDDAEREDLAHAACHDTVEKVATLLGMMKLLMPCQTEDKMKGNAPACDTVQ